MLEMMVHKVSRRPKMVNTQWLRTTI